MSIQPTKLERHSDNELLIELADGQYLLYTYQQLRDAYPCATCRTIPVLANGHGDGACQGVLWGTFGSERPLKTGEKDADSRIDRPLQGLSKSTDRACGRNKSPSGKSRFKSAPSTDTMPRNTQFLTSSF